MSNDLARRPLTRAECVKAPRPCPWADCRHHLASAAKPGTTQAETCALDVADRGQASLAEIGKLLGVSADRARQIEVGALGKLAALARRGAIEELRPGRSGAPAASLPSGAEESARDRAEVEQYRRRHIDRLECARRAAGYLALDEEAVCRAHR